MSKLARRERFIGTVASVDEFLTSASFFEPPGATVNGHGNITKRRAGADQVIVSGLITIDIIEQPRVVQNQRWC